MIPNAILTDESNHMVLTSMEVAEMIEKRHRDLMRDIKQYVEYFSQYKSVLADSNLDSSDNFSERKSALVDSNLNISDFFQKSTYEDKKGETRPCYLITKKGCEFIANKLIGAKGTMFTMKYIDVFHRMEEKIQTISISEQNAKRKDYTNVPYHSTTKIPKAIDNGYYENLDKIEVIEYYIVGSKRKLYHMIITSIKKNHDYDLACQQYELERGVPVKYAMDPIWYFDELKNEAVEFINDLIDKFISRDLPKYAYGDGYDEFDELNGMIQSYILLVWKGFDSTNAMKVARDIRDTIREKKNLDIVRNCINTYDVRIRDIVKDKLSKAIEEKKMKDSNSSNDIQSDIHNDILSDNNVIAAIEDKRGNNKIYDDEEDYTKYKVGNIDRSGKRVTAKKIMNYIKEKKKQEALRNGK